MTCIAIKDGIVAADSRVSGAYSSAMVKLYKQPGAIIGFAGEICEALVFVDWYRDRRNRAPDTAHETGWCALVLSEKDGIEYWDKSLRPAKMLELQAAIGSGAPFAIGAMDAGKSAAEAVKIACKRDPACGFPVMTARLSSSRKGK